MNRLVVPRESGVAAKGAGKKAEDDAIARLIKYIPAEVVSGYMLFSGIVQGAASTSPLKGPAQWGLFGLGLVLTPLYLWRIGDPKGVQWWHLPISAVSFVLWAYALGGPFTGIPIFGYSYEAWFAALLAGAFSWAVALFWKPTEKPKP